MIGLRKLACVLFLVASAASNTAEDAKPATNKPTATKPAATRPATKPAKPRPAKAKPPSAAPAPATPPPVEAFGQLPAISDVDISPSGSKLAWIDNSGKLARIVIFDLASNRAVREVNLPAETIPRRVLWADDATLLAGVSVTKIQLGRKKVQLEWRRWFAIGAVGGEPRMLLTLSGDLERNTGPVIVRRRTSKPGKIFMAAREAAPGLFSALAYNLYEVDLQSGEGKILERGSAFTTSWAVDATGNVVVRGDWNLTTNKFTVSARSNGGWRRLYEGKPCGRPWPLYLSEDNAAAIGLGSFCEDQRVKLWSLPLDGTGRKALVEVSQIDVEHLTLDPLDETVVAATLAGDGGQQIWLDKRAEQRLYALRRSFEADWITFTGRSADSQRVVIRVEGASRPPVYHLVDYTSKRADIVSEAYPKLANTRFGFVRSFNYDARDSYQLVARLTVPVDSNAQNLPLVVLVHDGPEDRDPDVFDWRAHFFASRGYAVLQPQFRGSTGFGLSHADVGRRQWGLRMQDDVTDAVRAAIAQGIADPKRVCIVGTGYGGYSALTGASATADLYACVASVAGISDLPSMLDYLEKTSDDFAYWRRHIGDSERTLIKHSPSRNVSAVRAPILLMHGTEDSVVPLQQSRLMARALKTAGKPHELVELPGEDHWMSQGPTRIRMLSELERFLAKHLGPAGRPN